MSTSDKVLTDVPQSQWWPELQCTLSYFISSVRPSVSRPGVGITAAAAVLSTAAAPGVVHWA